MICTLYVGQVAQRDNEEQTQQTWPRTSTSLQKGGVVDGIPPK